MGANVFYVASEWVRLGAMLNAPEALAAPDLERLLLDTARLARWNIRLFIVARTWLGQCADYVVGRRLGQLVVAELEVEHRATLGLLLESAYGDSASKAILGVIEECRQCVGEGCALAEVENRSAMLRKLSRERATRLSRDWGLWASADVFEARPDTLRPLEWIAGRNPQLARRAGLSEVSAFILAEWAGTEVSSVAEIARRAGCTPLAALSAVHRLRLAGWVRIRSEGRRSVVVVAA